MQDRGGFFVGKNKDFPCGEWVLEEMLKVAMEDEKTAHIKYLKLPKWPAANGIKKSFWQLQMMKDGIAGGSWRFIKIYMVIAA